MFLNIFKAKPIAVVPNDFNDRDIANIKFALNYEEGKIPSYSNEEKNDFVLLIAKLARHSNGLKIPEKTRPYCHLID